MVLPGLQWVVASSFGGSGGIYLIRASDRSSTLDPRHAARASHALEQGTRHARDRRTRPGRRVLTHGLSIQPGNNSVHRLFVVAHGGRESVEVFEVLMHGRQRQRSPGLAGALCRRGLIQWDSTR